MAERRKRIADAMLIIVLFLVALSSYFFAGSKNTRGKDVSVCIDGEEIGRYSLSEDITVSLNNGSNIMVIKDGTVYISEANCPDRLCVKQGKISHPKQCITCLPNHLTVSVEGEDSDVDVIG